MKISELIKALELLMSSEGDIDCMVKCDVGDYEDIISVIPFDFHKFDWKRVNSTWNSKRVILIKVCPD